VSGTGVDPKIKLDARRDQIQRSRRVPGCVLATLPKNRLLVTGFFISVEFVPKLQKGALTLAYLVSKLVVIMTNE
jgi:hypothetical protein